MSWEVVEMFTSVFQVPKRVFLNIRIFPGIFKTCCMSRLEYTRVAEVVETGNYYNMLSP
jgi:hypothetical protein